jgi:indole-3-glycerol phosphate synthase
MLDRIIAQKRKTVEQSKQKTPLSHLEKRIAQQKEPLDFARALSGDRTRLIAEVKRTSPSRGLLCPNFNPAELAKTYARGGAAAVSVLTEVDHFEGSLNHLAAIRKEIRLPLLRKDFIFDPYQVYESRAYGADALLLMASVLTQNQLEELLSLSHRLGLECLVEIHNQHEAERALTSPARIIGINNRDFNNFTVDINTTRRLRPLIPQQQIVVSESGINRRRDVVKLREWGVNTILVGEALVTANDILAKMRELIL